MKVRRSKTKPSWTFCKVPESVSVSRALKNKLNIFSCLLTSGAMFGREASCPIALKVSPLKTEFLLLEALCFRDARDWDEVVFASGNTADDNEGGEAVLVGAATG